MTLELPLARLKLLDLFRAVLDLAEFLPRLKSVRQDFGDRLAVLALEVADQEQPLDDPLQAVRVGFERFEVVAQRPGGFLSLVEDALQRACFAVQRRVDASAFARGSHSLGQSVDGAQGVVIVARERGERRGRRLAQSLDVLESRALNQQRVFLVGAQFSVFDLRDFVTQHVLEAGGLPLVGQ